MAMWNSKEEFKKNNEHELLVILILSQTEGLPFNAPWNLMKWLHDSTQRMYLFYLTIPFRFNSVGSIHCFVEKTGSIWVYRNDKPLVSRIDFCTANVLYMSSKHVTFKTNWWLMNFWFPKTRRKETGCRKKCCIEMTKLVVKNCCCLYKQYAKLPNAGL